MVRMRSGEPSTRGRVETYDEVLAGLKCLRECFLLLMGPVTWCSTHQVAY